jgi:hypothetical protein
MTGAFSRALNRAMTRAFSGAMTRAIWRAFRGAIPRAMTHAVRGAVRYAVFDALAGEVHHAVNDSLARAFRRALSGALRDQVALQARYGIESLFGLRRSRLRAAALQDRVLPESVEPEPPGCLCFSHHPPLREPRQERREYRLHHRVFRSGLLGQARVQWPAAS